MYIIIIITGNPNILILLIRINKYCWFQINNYNNVYYKIYKNNDIINDIIELFSSKNIIWSKLIDDIDLFII